MLPPQISPFLCKSLVCHPLNCNTFRKCLSNCLTPAISGHWFGDTFGNGPQISLRLHTRGLVWNIVWSNTVACTSGVSFSAFDDLIKRLYQRLVRFSDMSFFRKFIKSATVHKISTVRAFAHGGVFYKLFEQKRVYKHTYDINIGLNASRRRRVQPDFIVAPGNMKVVKAKLCLEEEANKISLRSPKKTRRTGRPFLLSKTKKKARTSNTRGVLSKKKWQMPCQGAFFEHQQKMARNVRHTFDDLFWK